MNRLTEKHLIILNEKIAERNGDISSVRDANVLKRVAEIPILTDNQYFYIHKNRVDKAAALAVAIVREKPFGNNNIATATLAMFTFLEVNGKKLNVTANEIYQVQEFMRNGELPLIVEWINNHG